MSVPVADDLYRFPEDLPRVELAAVERAARLIEAIDTETQNYMHSRIDAREALRNIDRLLYPEVTL
jgi:hypothetical protein